MNATDHEDGTPIASGTPLARALDDFAVPELPAGFADRVLAAAEAQSDPLAELRRSGGGSGRGWRLGRRISIATVGFTALATAAAATGLLERFDLPVPSSEKVWTSLTGQPTAPAASALLAAAPANPALAELAPVRIEGPINTPEELDETFRRIDEVRQRRSELRRQQIEQRITRRKERRAAAGLPLTTPEEEARIRQRIEAVHQRRESENRQRTEVRREELRERIEAGEVLTRKDIVRPMREEQRALQQRERTERLRRMSPEERREVLRRLPPEKRRALREAWQERRAQRLGEGALAAPETAPAPAGPDGPAAPERYPQP
jgi:hypothetical protein